jgi:hypothetical protein
MKAKVIFTVSVNFVGKCLIEVKSGKNSFQHFGPCLGTTVIMREKKTILVFTLGVNGNHHSDSAKTVCFR